MGVIGFAVWGGGYRCCFGAHGTGNEDVDRGVRLAFAEGLDEAGASHVLEDFDLLVEGLGLRGLPFGASAFGVLLTLRLDDERRRGGRVRGLGRWGFPALFVAAFLARLALVFVVGYLFVLLSGLRVHRVLELLRR